MIQPMGVAEDTTIYEWSDSLDDFVPVDTALWEVVDTTI